MRIGLWRKRFVGKQTSLIIISIVIGLVTALSAVLLKNGVRLIQEFVNYIIINFGYSYLLFVFPTVGILLTVIYTQVFRKGDLGRGVTNIIYSISRRESIVEKDKLYSQMLTSILTVGFGGSAGLEAPIASTGSAIGSRTAQWLLFDKKERTLLLACGAAAGIAAIFNAPIAGVVFAFEILLVDMPLLVAIPVLIASASSSILSRLIFSGQPFIPVTESWQTTHILFYLVFSILAAFVSVYAIRVYFFIGDFFARRSRPYVSAIVGGVLLGSLIFFFPLLYGEGYDSIIGLLHENLVAVGVNNQLITEQGPLYMIFFTLVLALLKVIATSLTVSAGGNGGMFGSSLFTGAMFGYAYAHAINLLGLGSVNVINFTVVGMAAAMSGIIQAPLTAIFLIAEITGGYALFVPLMVVSSVSYMITKYFEPFSVYTKKLATKGDLINIDKDKVVLSRMHVRDYIETDFIPVKENDTLRSLVKAIEISKRNIFPVVDKNEKLVGIILLDDVRSLIFLSDKYDKVILKSLMKRPPVIVDVETSMEDALKKFDDYSIWNLPVTEDGKYAGFVSKSKIFTQYRRNLIRDSTIPA
jgi:CIC family chloride channel protein